MCEDGGRCRANRDLSFGVTSCRNCWNDAHRCAGAGARGRCRRPEILLLACVRPVRAQLHSFYLGIRHSPSSHTRARGEAGERVGRADGRTDGRRTHGPSLVRGFNGTSVVRMCALVSLWVCLSCRTAARRARRRATHIAKRNAQARGKAGFRLHTHSSPSALQGLHLNQKAYQGRREVPVFRECTNL